MTAGVFGLLYLAVGIAVCVLLLVEDDGRPIDDTSDSDLALCGKVYLNQNNNHVNESRRYNGRNVCVKRGSYMSGHFI